MKRLNKTIGWSIIWVIALLLHQQLVIQALAVEPERIALAELKRLLDAKENVTLIDVRALIHHNFGHIPGAISMPFPDGIEARHQTLPPDGLIVFY